MDFKIEREHTIVKRLNDARWQPLFAWSPKVSPIYAFVVGAFYIRRDRSMRLEQIGEISLLPSYCYIRTYPEYVNERWIHNAIYVKMPLVCVDNGREAKGLWFPPFVEIKGQKIPLWFSFDVSNGRLTFELGVLSSYPLWRKRQEDYVAWNDTPLQEEDYGVDVSAEEVTFELVEYSASSWEELVRGCLEQQTLSNQPFAEPDWDFHFQKALRWLASVYEPKSGLPLEWKWRDREGFKGGFGFNLPCYNTLAADLYHLSQETKNPTIASMADGAKKVLLHPNASVRFAQGRVWHNTLAYEPLTKVYRFYTHLGTGLGGYPGGQATVLRALLERILHGEDRKSVV